MAVQEEFLSVKHRERIDQVAERAYKGNPLQYTTIAELNGDVDLFYPHPELVLRISGENPAAL
ncbi:MAG: hypothetical protein WBP42_11520 [Candidatus Zixiibacteriota bacterium]